MKLFKAKETTSCCWRVCCKQDRPYRMKVSDLTGTKSKAAMVFKRKYRCCGWAVIPCCAHRVDVHYMVDENNNTIGKESSRTLISKVQVPYCHGGCCFPTWHVQDRYGKTQSTITGPFCCVYVDGLVVGWVGLGWVACVHACLWYRLLACCASWNLELTPFF